jgi:hypothetical protein
MVCGLVGLVLLLWQFAPASFADVGFHGLTQGRKEALLMVRPIKIDFP